MQTSPLGEILGAVLEKLNEHFAPSWHTEAKQLSQIAAHDRRLSAGEKLLYLQAKTVEHVHPATLTRSGAMLFEKLRPILQEHTNAEVVSALTAAVLHTFHGFISENHRG